MLNLLGFILVLSIYLAINKYNKLLKVKSILFYLFWEDIFYAERNDTKIGITWYRRAVKAGQFMYILIFVDSIIMVITERDITFIFIMLFYMIAWPLMFRAVFYIQRKLWQIH